MIYLCLSTTAALRLSPVGVVQNNLAQLQQLDCGLDFPPAPPVQKWSRARTAARAPGAKKTAGFACSQTQCQTDPHPGDLIKCQATGRMVKRLYISPRYAKRWRVKHPHRISDCIPKIYCTNTACVYTVREISPRFLGFGTNPLELTQSLFVKFRGGLRAILNSASDSAIFANKAVCNRSQFRILNCCFILSTDSSSLIKYRRPSVILF